MRLWVWIQTNKGMYSYSFFDLFAFTHYVEWT